jgi:cell wall-associated protease
MKKSLIFLFYVIFLSNCKSTAKIAKNGEENNRINWYKKDFVADNTLGISLHLTSKLKKNKTDIIVAVIDSQIDINHEDLKNVIWTNSKEILDNGIDDDNNGYIDDIHGWNFLGTKSGNYIVWANFDFVRIIREYDSIFKKNRK